jgi:PAS domain-containing protein
MKQKLFSTVYWCLLGREGNMAKSMKKSSQSVKSPRKKQKKEIKSKPAEISRAINDFESLMDAAPDATVVINEEGNIVIVNKQLENIFGYSRGDLIGKTIRTLIPERFHEIHPQHRRRYFREPKVRPMGTGLKLHGRRQSQLGWESQRSAPPSGAGAAL